MKIMPIVYVTDMTQSVQFYEALGLKPTTQDRSGMWFEFTLGDAVLALHKAETLAPPVSHRVELSFVSTEPLENLVSTLQERSIEADGIVDEAFGRSVKVIDPDGLVIQINEHDEELYT